MTGVGRASKDCLLSMATTLVQRGPEIDRREEHDPDRVHEVPVDPHRADRHVPLVRDIAPKAEPGDDGERAESDDDVEAVEPGQGEEGRGEEILAEGDVL